MARRVAVVAGGHSKFGKRKDATMRELCAEAFKPIYDEGIHQDVIDAWAKKNFQGSPIGIGIATGDLIAGEMGCSKRTDYTVIGRAANLGARICGVAGAGEVLISESTFKLVKNDVEAVPVTGLELKGIGEDITVYKINEVSEIDG